MNHLNSRFTVYVYTINGVDKRSFFKRSIAIRFAQRKFEDGGVYKVKVWNGDPVPNVDTHDRLILHLV